MGAKVTKNVKRDVDLQLTSQDLNRRFKLILIKRVGERMHRELKVQECDARMLHRTSYARTQKTIVFRIK
jgi:hypothetical protein